MRRRVQPIFVVLAFLCVGALASPDAFATSLDELKAVVFEAERDKLSQVQIESPTSLTAGAGATPVSVKKPAGWINRAITVAIEAYEGAHLMPIGEKEKSREIEIPADFGSHFSFLLDPGPRRLVRPAKKRDLLLSFEVEGFEGKKVPAQVVALAVSAPHATLEKTHVEKYLFEAFRGTKRDSGKVQVRLPLVETSGQAPLETLEVSVLPPHGDLPSDLTLEISSFYIPCSRGGTRSVFTPGLEMGCPEGRAEATSSTGEIPLGLEAGSSEELHLELSGFQQAGRFEVDLLLSSPDLEEPTLRSFTVVVSDEPILPFLTIVLGVLFAFTVVRSVSRLAATRNLDQAISAMGPMAGGGGNLSARLMNHVPIVPKGLILDMVESQRISCSKNSANQGGAEEKSLEAVKETIDGARQQIEGTRMKAGDLGLLVLALLVASVLAFENLYFADTYFGTAQQYLEALTYGVSSQFSLSVIVVLTEAIKKRWPV